MSRRERKVGLIQCGGEAETLNAIAEASGLSVRPAEAPNSYYVVDSGRNLASEVEPALFAAVSRELDRAWHRGEIPHWSILEGPNA